MPQGHRRDDPGTAKPRLVCSRPAQNCDKNNNGTGTHSTKSLNNEHVY